MKRWIFAATLTTLALGASAQMIRDAPADVRPAQLVVTAPPEITLDGKPDRLSPGARIRDTNNMLVLSGTVVGQALPVVYRRDAAGLVHEAWVLTPEEYSRVASKYEGANGNGGQLLADLLNLIFGARRK